MDESDEQVRSSKPPGRTSGHSTALNKPGSFYSHVSAAYRKGENVRGVDGGILVFLYHKGNCGLREVGF